MDYELDVKIDPNALDVEWLKQAELMLKYTEHSAMTKKEVDNLKEELEFLYANLDSAIRDTPSMFGLSKVTEGAIKSAIILQDSYQELIKKYNEAKYEQEVAIGAVRAIDQKKTALENLVRLFGASYFAGPSVPRDLSKEYLKNLERKKGNKNIKINVSRNK